MKQLETVAKNAMLNAVGSSVNYIQIGDYVGDTFTLHDTQAITWTTSTVASLVIAANVVFDLLQYESCRRLRIYAGDPAAAGVLWGVVDITLAGFDYDGTYTLTGLTIGLTDAV